MRTCPRTWTNGPAGCHGSAKSAWSGQKSLAASPAVAFLTTPPRATVPRTVLFNSYVFLFAFLPVVAVGFFALGALRWRRVALAWLVLASLYFYAFWNVADVPLLAGSIPVNY